MRAADREYYARRAADERAAAEVARNVEAARIHFALAERYAALAGDVEVPLPAAVADRRKSGDRTPVFASGQS